MTEYEKEIGWSLVFLSKCGPMDLTKGTQESFLALSLREKRVKLEVRILILHRPVEIERLLGCLSWQESRKKWGGAWWLHGQPSLGLWVVNMHETLALCVEFQLVACGWNFHYKISCIICLIKIPTMYVIN